MHPNQACNCATTYHLQSMMCHKEKERWYSLLGSLLCKTIGACSLKVICFLENLSIGLYKTVSFDLLEIFSLYFSEITSLGFSTSISLGFSIILSLDYSKIFMKISLWLGILRISIMGTYILALDNQLPKSIFRFTRGWVFTFSMC